MFLDAPCGCCYLICYLMGALGLLVWGVTFWSFDFVFDLGCVLWCGFHFGFVWICT